MTVEIIDERQRFDEPIKERYPLGAIVYVRNRSYRATIVGYGDDNDTIVVLNSGRRTPVSVMDNDIIVLGRSAEEYAQRVRDETHKIANEHNVRHSAVDDTLDALTSAPDLGSTLLHVVVTTVGHYTLVRGGRTQSITDDAELISLVRQAYLSSHGEFNYDYFRQVDQGEGNNTNRAVLITFDVVDEFPALTENNT